MGGRMPGKRYSTEQIVAKLREAEKLQGQGVDDPGGVQEARDLGADVLSVAARSTAR